MSPLLTRILVYGVVAGLVLSLAELDGYRRGEKKLWEYQAEQARATVVIVKKIEIVKETVRVPYIKRELVIHTVFEEIVKESAHVPSRPACNITFGWMRGHNAAADAGRPEGALDDPGDTGITEAQALAAVQANYRAYQQIANDLTACRGFVNGLATVK